MAIHNFRDFGGYLIKSGGRVKPGWLFRSGSLGNASAADLAELVALGVRMVIDLRSESERTRQPDRLLPGGLARYVPVPMPALSKDGEAGRLRQLVRLFFSARNESDYRAQVLAMYRRYISEHNRQLGQVMRLAAEVENLPLLVHCTAGKDRTGLAAGLLLLLLGVSEEQVLAEYLLTNQALAAFKTEMLRKVQSFRWLEARTERFEPLFEARREYFDAALEQMRRKYGGIEQYAHAGLGLTEEVKCKLRQVLISP